MKVSLWLPQSQVYATYLVIGQCEAIELVYQLPNASIGHITRMNLPGAQSHDSHMIAIDRAAHP